MVPGLANHLRRAGDDLRKLFAEQHENDAVSGKLNRVPDRAATNPGDGECLAGLFDVTHGDASGPVKATSPLYPPIHRITNAFGRMPMNMPATTRRLLGYSDVGSRRPNSAAPLVSSSRSP